MVPPSMPAVIIILVKDRDRAVGIFYSLKELFQDSPAWQFQEMITNQSAVQLYRRMLEK
jgi:hypothetical protein